MAPRSCVHAHASGRDSYAVDEDTGGILAQAEAGKLQRRRRDTVSPPVLSHSIEDQYEQCLHQYDKNTRKVL
jgi:hypothetical protein